MGERAGSIQRFVSPHTSRTPSFAAPDTLAVRAPAPAAELVVVSRPRMAQDTRMRWAMFAVLAGVSMAISVVWALAGAWPVMPYALVEWVVLAAAFGCVERRARSWEQLEVVGDRVIVESKAGARRTRRIFRRAWLAVDAGGTGPGGAMTLTGGGQAVRFGAALKPAERLAVARALLALVAAAPRG